MPKAIFYLLKGDYRFQGVGFRVPGLEFRVVFKVNEIPEEGIRSWQSTCRCRDGTPDQATASAPRLAQSTASANRVAVKGLTVL